MNLGQIIEKPDFRAHPGDQIDKLLALMETEERSEEHTSELQSRENLVCRLLLEKKKQSQEPVASEASCSKRPSLSPRFDISFALFIVFSGIHLFAFF